MMECLGSVPRNLQSQFHRNHKGLEMYAELGAFSLLWSGFIVFNLIFQEMCDSHLKRVKTQQSTLGGEGQTLSQLVSCDGSFLHSLL